MVIASNVKVQQSTTGDLPDYPATIPEYLASGSNPNMTREGYTVTLSTLAPGAIAMFDPAGRGNTSLWGLHVDKMRVAYYGIDNQWHEASFEFDFMSRPLRWRHQLLPERFQRFAPE